MRAFVWATVTEVPNLSRVDAHWAPPYGDDAGRLVGSIGIERVAPGPAEIYRLHFDAPPPGHGIGQAVAEKPSPRCRAQPIARLVLWSDTRASRPRGESRRKIARAYRSRDSRPQGGVPKFP